MKNGAEVRAQWSRASSVSMQEEMALLSFLLVEEENTLEATGHGALRWESKDLAPCLGNTTDLMGSLEPVFSPAPSSVSPSVKWGQTSPLTLLPARTFCDFKRAFLLTRGWE